MNISRMQCAKFDHTLIQRVLELIYYACNKHLSEPKNFILSHFQNILMEEA